MKNITPLNKFLGALLLSLIGCLMFTPVTAEALHTSEKDAFTSLILADVGFNAIVGVVMLIKGDASFMPQGMAFAVTREIWVDYVIKNLFKDNSFVQRCFNESDNVLNGVLVHIPQAGAKRRVVRNRTQLPAQIVQRSDTDVLYALDEYTTDPILITNAEKVELSYDKMDNILEEDMETMREYLSDMLLYHWRPELAASIIRTSGAAVGPSDNQTGDRKLFLVDDLKKARKMLNKQGVSKEDRIALLDSEFMDQLQNDPILKSRDVARELDMKNGTIERLFGFDIMERSSVLNFDNSGTPVAKLPDALPANSDNIGALIYQKNCVAKAMGTIDMFDDQGNPTYFGDIYSFLCRMGGRKRRADGKGVIGIVQQAA